jgi:hypothetical protein
MSTPTAARTSNQNRPMVGEFVSPGDRTTGQLDILMNDLTTYRFVQQVAVTPALARRILDLNAQNQRTKKDRKITVYARDMEKGRWRERTGQVIQIGTDGKLVNGQNRMHAVIQSGATVRFDICFGVDPDDMPVIDSHTPRTAADAIKVAGGGDLSHVTPIVKHVIAWEAGYPKGPSGSQAASYLEINDRYLADAKLFEAAAARGVDCGRRQVGTPAALGTAYFVLVKAADNKGAVDDLFDQLVSGVYPVSDPVGMGWGPYRLREKLIGYKRDRLNRADIIAMVVRVWNRHNTLVDGKREAVERVQAVRSLDGEGLTNANFPRPKKALSL